MIELRLYWSFWKKYFILIESLMETRKSDHILSNGLVAVVTSYVPPVRLLYCTPAAPTATAGAKEYQLSLASASSVIFISSLPYVIVPSAMSKPIAWLDSDMEMETRIPTKKQENGMIQTRGSRAGHPKVRTGCITCK
jgi:hypothetical protein